MTKIIFRNDDGTTTVLHEENVVMHYKSILGPTETGIYRFNKISLIDSFDIRPYTI